MGYCPQTWNMAELPQWSLGLTMAEIPLAQTSTLLSTMATAYAPRIRTPGDIVSFLIPPLHLFYKMKPEKRIEAYFIWTIIRPHWLEQVTKTPSALSTQSWRDVLSGTHFRSQHPKEVKFNILHFWRYGGDLVFSQSFQGAQDIHTGRLAGLEPGFFEDDNVQRVVIWDLHDLTIKVTFDAIDNLLTDKTKWTDDMQNERQKVHDKLWRSTLDYQWNVSRAYNKDVLHHQEWVQDLSRIVHTWPHAPQPDQLVTKYPLQLLKDCGKYLEHLSAGSLEDMETWLLAFVLATFYNIFGVMVPLPISLPADFVPPLRLT